MLDDAVAYVASVGPGFIDRIKGVSRAEIEAFEAMLGFPIPQAYAEFLAAMGRDSGGLHFFPDCPLDFDDVFKTYETEILTGQTPLLMDDALMIGNGLNPGMVYLSPLRTNNPAVYAELSGTPLYAESLSNMVCHAAFTRHQLGAYRKVAHLVQTPNDVNPIRERATQILLEHGYSALSFSDRAHGCFTSRNSAATISDIATWGRSISLGFRDEVDVGPVVNALLTEFKLHSSFLDVGR